MRKKGSFFMNSMFLKKAKVCLAAVALMQTVFSGFNENIYVYAADKVAGYNVEQYVEGEAAEIAVINPDKARSLNIRSGYGTGFPVLKTGDKEAVLRAGDTVAIIEEKMIDGGAVWCQIAFFVDGVEYRGYVNKEYIMVTGEYVKPIPLISSTPTPTPTPIPTPTPVITATPVPVVTDTVTPEETEKGGNTLAVVLGIIFLGVVLAAVIYYFVFKKKREKVYAENANKVDALKKAQVVKVSQGANNAGIPVMKKNRPVENTDENSQTAEAKPTALDVDAVLIARQEKARKANQEIIESSKKKTEKEDKDEANAYASSLKEREFIKEEIDSMKPGDLVYHEYFGKGVVFDTSDVNVIEVRFGQDARFLNRKSCIEKKLLRKL